VDWFAACFEIAALWLVGNKNKVGFLLGLVCNIAWIYYALNTKTAYALVFVCSVYFLLNIRNYIKWSREEAGSVWHKPRGLMAYYRRL